MATDSDFSLRTALIRSFQDSDVLLSRVAQNDAKYVYGARVSRDKVRMLMQAQEKFFKVLQKWYFMTEQQFFQLLLTLISRIRKFSTEKYKRELAKFDYRGDLLSQDEHRIVVRFIQEFNAANDAESLDDVYKWVSENKDKGSKTTYNASKAGMFRDSEFLKLLLRIFAGISDAYFKYCERNTEYSWPFTEDSEYFDFRMTQETYPVSTTSLSYDNVGERAVDIFSSKEAAINMFRKMLFFSGADSTANIEFCRMLDVKKHGNPFVMDFGRELNEYLEKKTERCPGNYSRIYSERMNEYDHMAVSTPNFDIVYKECALIEGKLQDVYMTPPGSIAPQMQMPTPVRAKEKKVVVETNTGALFAGAALVGAAVLAATYA